jgi:hypothetical protein
MCVGQMCVGQMCVGQMCVGQMCVGQMCVGQMCVGQMCVGQMIFDQKTRNLNFQSFFFKFERQEDSGLIFAEQLKLNTRPSTFINFL